MTRAQFALVLFILAIPPVLHGQPTFSTSSQTFYRGDGLGDQASLTLESDSSFRLQRFSDIDGAPPINQTGLYSVVRAHLVLFPNWRNVLSYAQGIPSHLVPIRWESRLYLVPQESIADFCNEVNMGLEPRRDPTGEFFLREGDWKRPVNGLPEVPAIWRPYLLAQPKSGVVIKLIDSCSATITLGTRDHILPGMTLVRQWDDNEDYRLMNAIMRVEQVFEEYSVIRSGRPGKLWIGAQITSRFKPPKE